MTNPDAQMLFTLTDAETDQLVSIDRTASGREVLGECLWLHISRHQRRWILENDQGRFVLTVRADHDEALCGRWYPLSPRLLHFAQSCPDDVTLSIAGTSVIAEAEGRSAVIDMVEPTDGIPDDWHVIDVASAEVDREAFSATMYAARFMPRGGDDVEAPTPPMWLQLADGAVALHVDWADWVRGASTYRITTPVTGEPVTVSIHLGIVGQWATLVSVWPEESGTTMTIAVRDVIDGGERRRALHMSAADAEMWLWITDPLVERWGMHVTRTLLMGDVDIVSNDGRRWQVTVDGIGVDVVLHGGRPDVARVTATIVRNVEHSLDLLAELNAINAATTGVRVWVDEGVVRAAHDVRCTELEGLCATVLDVARAAARYRPLLAPLGATL